jgi:2-hydroxychromene-2-carboxylate isomerase
LVTPDLVNLRDDYDVDVRVRIVYPIAVRDPSLLFTAGPHKARYIMLDSRRRAEFLGLPFAPPRPDPIVQDMATMEIAAEQPYIHRLSALGVEAQRCGKGIEYIVEVSALIFGGTEGWDQGEHLKNAVARAGLDLDELDAAIEDGDQLEEVESNQQALAEAGHWGVPTMVVRGEPFFGQDRIETLRWRLDQLGLGRG